MRLTKRDLRTISIFYRSKEKIDYQSVWNRLGWNPDRVKYKDVFHQKAQFTRVNEHFETIFNAAMVKKTTRAKVSKQFFITLFLSLPLFFSGVTHAKNADILLLKTYDSSQNVVGWLMSEKLDGMRAIWDGKSLKSRQGNPISTPNWFLHDLPPFAIDGELWTKRNDFENIVSIVRQQSADERWRTISYHIFEVPYQQGGLLERLAILQLYLTSHPSSFLKIIPQSPVQSASQLKRELDHVISLGGEGLVVRNPDTPYQTGRSSQALKVKPYQDSECTVIAFKEGRGKYLGKTGSLQCQLPSGQSFYIGSGLSDQQRLSPPKIGSTITFKYYGLTKNNLPRFPVFMRIRQTL